MTKSTVWEKLSNRDNIISAQRSEYDFFIKFVLSLLYENTVFSLHFDMFGLIYKRSEVS